MKTIRGVSLISVLVSIVACSTTEGPTRTLQADGPYRTDKDAPGLAGIFVESEALSRGDLPNSDKAQTMLKDGFALIYNNCNEFFYSAGKTQQWLVVSRDAVGAVGTLATSVLALHNASNNAVANLALVTGMTFSGIDIYTKNFLFASENVDAVRTLVVNALVVHQRGVASVAPFTYQAATVHLLDNQNICTPAAITTLVRQAIKKGDVQPHVTTGADQHLSDLGDIAVLQRIGELLNDPSAITPDQAGGLWWLFEGSPSTEQRSTIAKILGDLPEDGNPFDKSGEYKKSWKYERQVKRELLSFSAKTRIAFADTVAIAKKGASGAAAPLPPGAEATPFTTELPSFKIFESGSSVQSSRVSVDIP